MPARPRSPPSSRASGARNTRPSARAGGAPGASSSRSTPSPAMSGGFCTRRMRSTSLSDASCYSGTARVTAGQRAGFEDASPAMLPSVSFLVCGTRAPLWTPRLPLTDEAIIGLLGITGEIDLTIAQRLDVVGVSGARFAPFPCRLPGFELYRTQLVGDQGRTCPLVIGLLDQQVPAQHGQLARHGDRRNLMATTGADAQEERAQRAWALDAAQAASTSMARA